MSIFDHISIPVSDFDRSEAFYSSALWALGVSQKLSMPRPGGHVAGFGKEKASFFIASGSPSHGTIHLALAARSRAEVDAFHKAALTAGGRDNGAPGVRPRYHANYYAAFVFDLEGNNIEAVFQGEPD
jgi:catechol 2,3-dioxygenase-like lactoylglutathione lyase family enzyme